MPKKMNLGVGDAGSGPIDPLNNMGEVKRPTAIRYTKD